MRGEGRGDGCHCLTSYKYRRFVITRSVVFQRERLLQDKTRNFSKMAKIALICIVVIVCLQLAYANPRIVRDVAVEKTPDKLDEAFNSMKSNLDQLLKSVQDNDMLKQLNEKIQKFGADITAQGKQLAEKIQNSGKTE